MEFIIGGIILVAGLVLALKSFISIKENEVGILIKRYGPSLPHGKIIALNGEAGYQADTLPPGWHFPYAPWKYKVVKSDVIQIDQGEIALIVAEDGTDLPENQLLGQVVDCNNFQNARTFLTNNGQKGRQLGILKTGVYRINRALFSVITTTNAKDYGLMPDQLKVINIAADKVGVVTTQDGNPLRTGSIAGTSALKEHDSFQNPRKFLELGGFRGLQIEVLLAGQYNISPWFAKVEIAEMFEVPIANVGVVVSSSGDDEKDVSGTAFTHGNLVKRGGRGIWNEPLLPGKHPLNPRICKIEIVPTANVVLNWASITSSHKMDTNLSSIRVRAKDGFSFTLDVSQIIHVAANDAAKVISRVGSMKNLVENVLEPIIGNYFRNSAQSSDILEFINTRAEKQKMAAGFIRNALLEYNVVGVDTLIGDLTPPETLMATLTERKIASEQQATYKTKEQTEIQRQSFLKEAAIADTQQSLVNAFQSVNIAENNAKREVELMRGTAESMRIKAIAEAEATKVKAFAEADGISAIGKAKAASYELAVEAMGSANFATMEVMKGLGENNVKITPDIMVGGGGSDSNGTSGLTALLLTSLMKNKTEEKKAS